MSKKNILGANGYVYSTNPNFKIEEPTETTDTVAIEKQPLRIKLDTKQRAGKAVTLITGFIGTSSDIEILGKQLKTICGTGGSVKDGHIIIQGDNRDKVLLWLLKNNYKLAKKI